MGSGKTRVGQELAKLLKLPFVDSDKEIERAAGLTIPEIFERFGEDEFRKGERKVMLRLLNGGKVLASGGGAFIQPEIRDSIKLKATSIWLKATLETLVERTSRVAGKRPLLVGVDPAQKLHELMEARYPIYAEADVTMLTDEQTPLQMARRIRNELEKRFEPSI